MGETAGGVGDGGVGDGGVGDRGDVPATNGAGLKRGAAEMMASDSNSGCDSSDSSDSGSSGGSGGSGGSGERDGNDGRAAAVGKKAATGDGVLSGRSREEGVGDGGAVCGVGDVDGGVDGSDDVVVNVVSSSSQLAMLKKMTKVVADTGDFAQLNKYHPEDATTNPTLLLAASQLDDHRPLLEAAIAEGLKAAAASKGEGGVGVGGEEMTTTTTTATTTATTTKENLDEVMTGREMECLVDDVCDRLAVKFGVEILKRIPGVVSTEIDASLSFDTAASIAKARKLVNIYEMEGISPSRVLIKMATTWESIEAARQLEKEGIHCNMTLLFCLAQAVAAAEAGATLISPFVGRILDWHKKAQPEKSSFFVGSEDPGVKSVTAIYKYYKKFGFKTVVMGASFRNKGEIVALAGCDKLTVSPKLLEELKISNEPLHRVLNPNDMNFEDVEQLRMEESDFRWHLTLDAMATEKLAEGIRNFHFDLQKLKIFVKTKIEEQRRSTK